MKDTVDRPPLRLTPHMRVNEDEAQDRLRDTWGATLTQPPAKAGRQDEAAGRAKPPPAEPIAPRTAEVARKLPPPLRSPCCAADIAIASSSTRAARSNCRASLPAGSPGKTSHPACA